MKKILLSIVMLVMAFTKIMAQQTNAKVAFKGITLNDKAVNFVNKLKAKDFIQKTHSDGTYIMTGKFLNEDCFLFVFEAGDSIRSIQANYGIVENPILGIKCPFKFSKLHDYYVSVVNLYKEKYGDPVESVDNSSDSYDGMEIYDLKDGKIQVQSVFRSDDQTDGGVIVITLSPVQAETGHGAFVSIVYNTDISSARQYKSNLDEI